MPKDTINKLNQSVTDRTDAIDRNVAQTGGWLSQLDVSTRKFRDKKGSIVKSAKGNIFEFPVFISSSIPMEYAQATTTLLEQVYASYLQMAISINPVIDHTQAVSGVQFSALKSDTNRYLEYTDTMWQHDACHAIYENEDCVVEFSLLAYEDNDAAVILESVNHQPLEEFTHFFTEEDARVVKNRQKVVQNERKARKKAESERDEALSEKADLAMRATNAEWSAAAANREKDKAIADAKASKHTQQLSQKALKNTIVERDRLKRDLKSAEDKRDSLQKQVDQLTDARAQAEEARAAAKETRDIEKHQKELDKLDQEIKAKQNEIDANDKKIKKLDQDIEKNQQEIDKNKREAEWDKEDRSLKQADLANKARVNAPKFIGEKDIEKLNTMKPLLMNVDLNVRADNGTLSPVSYIVGVKTYNRIIDADTIPEVAEYPLKEMNRVMRKAKWRAGELKFFSDIVFRIKQKKQNAIDKKDPKRKWYRRLYELAHMKGDAPTTSIVNGNTVIGTFIADKMGKTKAAHGVIPNVSMIISKSDVDICKMKTGIDLLNAGTASSLCNELFLMSFIVIDNDLEQIKILLPDLHNDFDVHSLASVNRQIASLDTAGKKTRDIFNMLNR